MRLLAVLLAAPAILPSVSHATDCPPAIPSCKVLILSPDEERALTGQNMVFDTAAQGRPLDLAGVVSYFRNKIEKAPAGEVKRPVPPTAPPTETKP